MTAVAIASLLALLAAPAGEGFVARVVAVHDGDTVTVRRTGRDQVRIRIEGIDCPELGQAFGRRAKEFTAALVFGRVVTVLPKEHDRHGRLVARIVVDGKDVSLELVRAGLAWHFKKYSADRRLAEGEFEAREAKRGLWRQTHSTPPWDFRHGATPGSIDGDTTLHGNDKSRAYHRPGCPSYNCPRCTMRFKTDEEARAAGFRPAGCCARR